MGEEFKVVAVVKFNDGEAIVLDRPIKFVYEEVGRDYVGSDGPFRDFLGYGSASEHSKAFAGRTLILNMADGSKRAVKENWWSTWKEGYNSIPAKDIEGLKKCYVFGSAHITPEDYASLRGAYTGAVFDYWDYEKILKHEYWVNLFCKEQEKVYALRDKERKRLKRGDLIHDLLVGRSILLRAAKHLNDFNRWVNLPCDADDLEKDHIGQWFAFGKAYGYDEGEDVYFNMVTCPRCSAQYSNFKAKKMLVGQAGRITGILTRMGNHLRDKE